MSDITTINMSDIVRMQQNSYGCFLCPVSDYKNHTRITLPRVFYVILLTYLLSSRIIRSQYACNLNTVGCSLFVHMDELFPPHADRQTN